MYTGQCTCAAYVTTSSLAPAPMERAAKDLISKWTSRRQSKGSRLCKANELSHIPQKWNWAVSKYWERPGLCHWWLSATVHFGCSWPLSILMEGDSTISWTVGHSFRTLFFHYFCWSCWWKLLCQVFIVVRIMQHYQQLNCILFCFISHVMIIGSHYMY